MNIMANATMTLVIEFMSVPNPILDNGKSLGETLNIVVVNSDNSAVLNWAELDTSRITNKWSQEDKYYIK